VSSCFDSIKEEFYELRDFILVDLRILLGSPAGGNYAAALLITTACEVVGPLRYENNGEREFFKNYLIPETWRPVAASVYDALRNGLAHSFATKTIMQINGSPVEIGVSWKDKPHFKYDATEATVYINVRELSEALERAFEAYENELANQSDLCDLFRKRRQRKRTVDIQDFRDIRRAHNEIY
jgi:hypothetical protein